MVGLRKILTQCVPHFLTVSILERFDEELQKKTTTFAKETVLFPHDDAPAHISAVARAKLAELSYEPIHRILFSILKKSFSGKKFDFNAEVVADAEA